MRIAYLASRFPFPVEKGDKLRAYHHIRYLSTLGDVCLFALSHDMVEDEHIAELRKYCSAVHVYPLRRIKTLWNTARAVLSGLPFQVGYFLDLRQKNRLVKDLVSLQPDAVFAQLVRTTEYVKGVPVFKVLDYMDTFSIGATQRAGAGNILLRPLYALESKLVRNYERSIYADFNRHMIISRQDRDRLPLPYRKSVAVVPNGVDLDFFSPMDIEKRFNIIFVGNMGYMPNIEAAEYLIRRIMPIVWKMRPETTVCLAGARPARRVLRLASDRTEVTGWIEDVRPYYACADIFVAPMFSGMGLQNKILEAMAMGVPCVTSPIVNNAIGADPGREIVIGSNAQAAAEQIIYLLRDDKLRQDLSKAGRSFVERQFSWETQNNKIGELMEPLINSKGRHPAEETPIKEY